MQTLKLMETGGHTARTPRDDNEMDWWRAAADRLVARNWPEHFARFGSVGGFHDGELHATAEVCRAVGGMTEHTSEFVTFEIVGPRDAGYSHCADHSGQTAIDE